MTQEILVNVTQREVRIALLENSVLQEIYIERSIHQEIVGNIYKGRVSRILPGLQAAFVDIGLDRAAFLHTSDMGVENDLNTLTVGKEIIVQVYKDQLGTKGARLTTQITLPSRYLVLTPGTFEIAISQKIVDEAERQKMLTMITPGISGGYIFRTAAVGVALPEIEQDKASLEILWSTIEARTKQTKAPGIVFEEIPRYLRILRDLVGNEVTKILVDDTTSFQQMQNFASSYAPDLTKKIELFQAGSTSPLVGEVGVRSTTGEGCFPPPTKNTLHPPLRVDLSHKGRGENYYSLFDKYNIESELQNALSRKVPLKSGGHIIFDQTEAMTTIDVNTGSNVGQNDVEQTILSTNLEAAAAIAHQVRLRNIGGIIIIDFIDMTDPQHKEQLLAAFNTALAKDSARTQISEISNIGLVQMTRKRNRESLEHILCAPCPTCQSRGSVKSLSTMCYEIFREILRIEQSYPWENYLIQASSAVIEKLTRDESTMLADLAAQLGKSIRLQVETTYLQERYDILPDNKSKS